MGPSRYLAPVAACLLLLAFRWRAVLSYWNGDDLANLYGCWSKGLADLIRGNLLFWTPYYRPLGAAVYYTWFSLFGLNPLPLYLFFYLMLLVNIWLLYWVSRVLSGSDEVAAFSVILFPLHAAFAYLYASAGSIYEAFCFFFYFLAFLLFRDGRGAWRLVLFVLAFVLCLNSKENGVTLPSILLLYELAFRPGTKIRWPYILLSAAVVIAYIPAKLGSSGLTTSPAYVPSFTWARGWENLARYTGYVVDADPLPVLGVLAFYGVLIGVALLLRSRLMAFGVCFFLINLLPVLFVPWRLGYVLYLPMAGLALWGGVLLSWARSRMPMQARLATPAMFAAVLGLLAWVHGRRLPPLESPADSPYRTTAEQLPRLQPKLAKGSTLLFVKDLHPGNFDLLMLVRLLYRDPDLEVVQFDGPEQKRLPIEKLGKYDGIFTYADGYYVALDDTDAKRSVRMSLVKPGQIVKPIGESVRIGTAGQSLYFMKDILASAPPASECWTRQSPEIRFRLDANRHYEYRVHFYLPGQTLEKTGPMVIRYFVNDHELDRVRYDKPEDQTFARAVPREWIRPDDFTTVRMFVENPYTSPDDGAKLGFLLREAGFHERE